MEKSGHKVTCLDLKSAGIDQSNPNTILTFDEYNAPIKDWFVLLEDFSPTGIDFFSSILLLIILALACEIGKIFKGFLLSHFMNF